MEWRRVEASRGAKSCLLFLTFLAFALRLYRLGGQSLWYDEGFSVYLARMSLGEITARTASDIHPPLYYYLLHFWLGPFGDSEFALRFLSLLFGLLTVPLIYILGQRLMGPLSGLLAALLVAISPVYLWYSQEARMYTLVTFLSLLSSYLLLRALERKNAPLWVAYAAVNILAVYSHFYAFFILAFHLLFLLAWALRRGDRSLLIKGLVAQGAVVLAYLPWSGFVLRRYAADVSYWGGELVLSEALRKTLILFSTGHTILEATAQPISLVYAALALAGLAILLLPRKAVGEKDLWPRWQALYLLLYLLLPLLLLFLISYQRPKFHPRYLLLASPAFFLLIGGALGVLWERGRKAKGWTGMAFQSLAVASFLFVSATSAYADFNNYYDIRFTKDDFRSAARYIQSHIQEGEVVILTSGHLFPVFTYYYQGDNWYPIPDEPTLSTEKVLNYSLADDLNRILEGKRGVWVLLWQDEVVDPNGFLTMMLEEEGEPLPVEGGFWGLKLRHYALPPDLHFSNQPQIDHAVRVNFEDKVILLGYSLSTKGEAQGLEITLYWQGLQELKGDYKVSLRLRDEEGHYWGRVDARPASYWYPTMRWRPGEVFFGRHVLEPLPGTPPGEYRLEVGLYTEEDPRGLDVWDEKGTPLGKGKVVGEVQIVASGLASPQEVKIASPLEATWEGLALLGDDWPPGALQPGDTTAFTLFWQALSSLERDYVFRLRLVDSGGQSIEGDIYPIGSEAYPTSRWQEGEVIRGQYDYTIPAWPIQPRPGKAEVRLELIDEEGEAVAPEVVLLSLDIEPTERVFQPPSPQYPLPEGSLGGLVRLVGYDLETERVRPGGTLVVTFYWQALAPLEESYTVFTHLLDGGNQVRAQKDSLPLGGARPTTGWVPGEYIADRYELVVDKDAPPGEYLLEVGMYEAASGDRLPVFDREGKVVDDRILLPTAIQVGE